MANGKTVFIKKSELLRLKKTFESERVKNDFYRKYNVDAGCMTRVLALGRCSQKTYNKLFKNNANTNSK